MVEVVPMFSFEAYEAYKDLGSAGVVAGTRTRYKKAVDPLDCEVLY